MDKILAAYSSQNDSAPPLKKLKVELAPVVPDALIQSNSIIPSGKEVYYNPTVDKLYQPMQGPTQPHLPNSLQETKNCWTGHVEGYYQNHETFNQQYNTFYKFGYAHDPAAPLYNHNGAQNFIGDVARASQTQGATILDIKTNSKKTRKRKASGNPRDESFLGPWAPYEEDLEQENILDKIAEEPPAVEPATESIALTEPTEENPIVVAESSATKPEKPRHKEDKKLAKLEKSVLHKKERYDYLGRTYIDPPSGLKVHEHDCFLPKKKIHTWVGHTKAIAAVRLFPKTAHILLSADFDGRVKLWDYYDKRRVLRTYYAHSQGIRDVCFSPNGHQFLTSSFDRYIKMWDTESGECIAKLTNQKTPICVQYYPEDPNICVSGYSDKKIYQWDIRANETVLEYDRHLGPVNTITFIDENRKFVSTSDDKSIRVWDWNIPVDVKYISEPHMHSMPAVTLSPTKKWLACQSLDNQILIYGVGDRFKLNKKKRFQGHLVAGYSCQPGFSSDGKYVTSGDSEGNLTIWDWKSQKIYKKIKAHDGVCIGAVWHPIEASQVVTCGWDGRIHLWD